MKTRKLLLFLTFGLVSLNSVYSQNEFFTREFANIDTELQNWDPLRGEWLSKSIQAIALNQVIPDRNFPENFTPYEMITILPISVKDNIRNNAGNNKNTARQTNSKNIQLWETIVDLFSRLSCQTLSGRTFGDPHFTSFDGNSYSMQSVGEFVLAKSNTGYFEVQTRQKASSADVSLNVAVAMNVGGDRLCIYGLDKPDSDNSTDLRLDGKPIHVENITYFLPHGGTIKNTQNDYVITWPTGEKVSIQKRNSGFMNISTIVYPCIMGGYQGLLGNANGVANDDLRIPNHSDNSELYASLSSFTDIFGNTQVSAVSNQAEKEYLHKLNTDFGTYWRVTDQTSLFDYWIGNNTATFTDLSFPQNHRTVGDLDPTQRETARKNCENQGIRGGDLKGCIFDNAVLNIPPAPRPVIKDETKDVVIPRIPKENAKPNINRPQIQNEHILSPNTDTPLNIGKPSKVENVDELKVISPAKNETKPLGKEGALEPVILHKEGALEPVDKPVYTEPTSKPITIRKEGALEPINKPVYIETKSKPVYTIPETKSSPAPIYIPPVSKPASVPTTKPVVIPTNKPVIVPENKPSIPAPTSVPILKKGGF